MIQHAARHELATLADIGGLALIGVIEVEIALALRPADDVRGHR